MGKPFLQFLFEEQYYFSCRKCKNHIANAKHLQTKNKERNKSTGILNFRKLFNIKNVKIKKKHPLFHNLHKSNLIYCLKCDLKIGMIRKERKEKKNSEIFSIYRRSVIENYENKK